MAFCGMVDLLRMLVPLGTWNTDLVSMACKAANFATPKSSIYHPHTHTVQDCIVEWRVCVYYL